MSVGDVLRTVATGTVHPDGVAWDGSTLWLYDGGSHMLLQFDTVTESYVRSSVFPGTSFGDISFAHGVLLCGTVLYEGVGFVDPHTGTVLRKLTIPAAYCWGLAWDGNSIWYYNLTTGLIKEVNPYTGATLRSFARPGSAVHALAWYHGTLLVMDATNDTIYQVNPYDGSVIRSIAAPDTNCRGLEVVQNTLWVCGMSARKLYQLALN